MPWGLLGLRSAVLLGGAAHGFGQRAAGGCCCGLAGADDVIDFAGMSRGIPCCLRSPLAPVSSSSRSVSAMRLRATSTSSTLTLTMSPDFTTSRGSLMKVFDIAEMCTRPSWCTPISTKAPNAATLVTVPSRIMPFLRSFRVSTPSLNTAALKAGRGSRPGFSSSRRMSVTVGKPNVSSTKVCGFNARTISALPISALMSLLVAVRILRTTG